MTRESAWWRRPPLGWDEADAAGRAGTIAALTLTAAARAAAARRSRGRRRASYRRLAKRYGMLVLRLRGEAEARP